MPLCLFAFVRDTRAEKAADIRMLNFYKVLPMLCLFVVYKIGAGIDRRYRYVPALSFLVEFLFGKVLEEVGYIALDKFSCFGPVIKMQEERIG